MERTKTNFRALRETIGLSQSDVAGIMGVETRSVRRWETPGRLNEPPAAAWELLEALAERQRAQIEFSVNKMVEMFSSLPLDAPRTMQITYYRDQAQYDEFGRDQGPYGIVNATGRAIAAQLLRYGIESEFVWPDDPENAYRQASAKLAN